MITEKAATLVVKEPLYHNRQFVRLAQFVHQCRAGEASGESARSSGAGDAAVALHRRHLL